MVVGVMVGGDQGQKHEEDAELLLMRDLHVAAVILGSEHPGHTDSSLIFFFPPSQHTFHASALSPP